MSSDRLAALEVIKAHLSDVPTLGFLIPRSFPFSVDEERARKILASAPPRTPAEPAPLLAAAVPPPPLPSLPAPVAVKPSAPVAWTPSDPNP